MKPNQLTQSYLKDVLLYDYSSGLFTWRVQKSSSIKIGDIAGCEVKLTGKRYINIKINSKTYLAHRLVFLYVDGEFPVNDVDHHDGDGTNNRWANLHIVTKQGNQRNRKLNKNNISGVSGIYKTAFKTWRSEIRVDGRSIRLGCFSDFNDAVIARKAAERKYGFHPNHGQDRPS